jgi:putative ABC transport system permease protein
MFEDLRFGIRLLLKKPAYALTAVLTLAIGIGANTAIFSVINGALLRPLPYSSPEQIVRLFEKVDRTTMSSDRMEVAPANFLDWKEQSSSFSGVAIFALTGLALSDGGEAERIEGALVSVDFFQVLGVNPVLGRAFTEEDQRSAYRYLAVISFGLWQRRFGRSPDIIGRNVQLDGYSFEVIGVMPQGFEYPQHTDLWELYRLSPSQRQMREARFLKVVARLKPEVSVTQAQVEMTEIAGRLAEQYPQTNANWGVSVVSLLDEKVGKLEPTLLILFGAVVLVLLIGSANVASLMLARATARRVEIGIRLALGASRGRITRQLLTESLLLAAVGGMVGLFVGVWGLDVLRSFAPRDLPRLDEVSLDYRVFGFTFLISILTGILFGLAPAWHASKQDAQETLKEASNRASGRATAMFGVIVAAEIALALMVLVGAGLLVASFIRLQQVEPGVDVERLLTVTFEPPSSRYNGSDSRAMRLNFWNQLSSRVETIPGVEGVGAVDSLPFGGSGRVWRFRHQSESPNEAAGPAATFHVATGNYFQTAGLQLIQGRFFNENDVEGSLPVALVNQRMARRFWLDENPVGQRIVIRNEQFAREIVGIVGDVKHFGLERETEPEMYVPFPQFVIDVMPMVVRVSDDPSRVAAAVREQVQEVDPTVAVASISPMEDLLSVSLGQRRFTMILLGLFAIIALLLAGIGVYGVMAYSVERRTREIGIRMALGAQPATVLSLMLRRGMTLVIIGVVAGVAGALVFTRFMKTLLYGLEATDPLTFILIVSLLTVVAMLACYIAARRATKLDPLTALRCE